MTQDDIDCGHVVILVGFAPPQRAEFEVISIQQRTGQSQTRDATHEAGDRCWQIARALWGEPATGSLRSLASWIVAGSDATIAQRLTARIAASW